MRERAFSRFPQETQALFKVVGIADMAAWTCAKTDDESDAVAVGVAWLLHTHVDLEGG